MMTLLKLLTCLKNSVQKSENKTVVLLEKCADETDTQRRIANYVALDIPLHNIKIHPDNGGDEKQYGYIHLGVPVGSETYKHDHLHSLVDNFIVTCQCDEVGISTMGSDT